jgi:Glutaminyl-tRNA synthetase, non-specific RNA binding region part 1
MGPTNESPEALEARFAALGLNNKAIKETLKNKRLTESLISVLGEAGLDGPEPSPDFDKSKAGLFPTLATLAKDGQLDLNRPFIAKAIRTGRLNTPLQVEGQ